MKKLRKVIDIRRTKACDGHINNDSKFLFFIQFVSRCIGQKVESFFIEEFKLAFGMKIVHGKAINDRVNEVIHVFVFAEVRLKFFLQLITFL